MEFYFHKLVCKIFLVLVIIFSFSTFSDASIRPRDNYRFLFECSQLYSFSSNIPQGMGRDQVYNFELGIFKNREEIFDGLMLADGVSILFAEKIAAPYYRKIGIGWGRWIYIDFPVFNFGVTLVNLKGTLWAFNNQDQNNNYYSLAGEAELSLPIGLLLASSPSPLSVSSGVGLEAAYINGIKSNLYYKLGVTFGLSQL